MDSGMISKIEGQALRRGAERVSFQSFVVQFRGTHEPPGDVRPGAWSCAASSFQRGVCSHTMAMERLLDPMLTISLGSPSDEPVGEEEVAR